MNTITTPGIPHSPLEGGTRPFPTILGHEFSGVVEVIDPACAGVQVNPFASGPPGGVKRVPLEASIPDGAVSLESILCTEELRRRPWRPPDYEKENRALVALAGALADSPRTILQTLAETILEVTQSDSSGLSLLTTDDGGKRFYWPAIAGRWKPHIGGGTPRDFGPCGDVLDRNIPLLFRHFERRYTYFLPVTPLVEECLLIPFYVGGKAVGTIWAVMHDDRRKFDAEDERLMSALGKFASSAYQTLTSLNDLKVQIAEREKAETAKARLEREKIYLQEEIKTQHNFEEIIGQSPAIKKVLKAAETVAPTDATVLLLGETGTGKELIARAVHNLSSRRAKPLVRVNCAALPAGLIESELFGHEKGAFTGALARRIGRFELADGGTIFLDEIGDLPLDLQAKLLRVLQEGEFERVGSSSTLKVDVRVIAATHRDLEKASQQGRVRSDLYYRLNVFPIRIPPLRERKEDTALLVRHFVVKYGAKIGKRIEAITQRAMDDLLAYPWPGNVRELQNVIERGVIVSMGSQLELGGWLPKPGITEMGTRILMLEDLEREHIIKTLELTDWRVSGNRGAAKLLGLKPTTLDARMKKLGITRKG